MGIEVQVGSLEEMCDLMYDNKLPTPKEEWWVFTFGYGTQYAGKYVKIRGTYGEARNKMFEKYGENWAFQYSWDEWQKMSEDPHRPWIMETELEVIE